MGPPLVRDAGRAPGGTGEQVTVLEQGRLCVAVIEGRDLLSPRFEDGLERLIERRNGRALVVDLSRVESTVSRGAELLISAQGLAAICQTRIAFAGVRPRVRRLLESYGAERALALYETVDEALDVVRGPSTRSGPRPEPVEGRRGGPGESARPAEAPTAGGSRRGGVRARSGRERGSAAAASSA
jgi:anti-anti-sigma regulatory factor